MKNRSGITLVALTLTIVIMAILARITFNALVGENGIVSKAQIYSDLNTELKNTGKIVGIQVLPNSMPPIYQVMLETIDGVVYEIMINKEGEITQLERAENQNQEQYLAKLKGYSVNENNMERIIKMEGPYTQEDANLFTYTIECSITYKLNNY